MSYFSWLHFTDLHQGMQEQNWLWPGIKEEFVQDLQRLHDKCGPWDLVLFTGDLTQRGSAEEFEKINATLEELWTYFHQLGSYPQLLAVPGNHDLVRPNQKNPTVRLLQQWLDLQDVQVEFWEGAKSPYRQVVKQAFKNYAAWWEKQPFKIRKLSLGILPGDFAATFEKEGAKLGIVGLNTSFLQLTGANYEGKLALHARQFHEACGGDGVSWTKQHNACLLLTHHPMSWLAPESQQQLKGEILAHGRFVAHLCGHMHDAAFQEIAEGGTEARRTWQGRSLFGLEYFGNNEESQRLHGYTAGRIELSGYTGQLMFWPREARVQGGQRKIVPDYALDLTDQQHTKPIKFELLQPCIDPEDRVQISSAEKLHNYPQSYQDVLENDKNQANQAKECSSVSPSMTCLDEPRGWVPLDSIFYIGRSEIEDRCYREITKRAALIRIRAPLDMGKTSLMTRILDYAEKQDCQTILLSFERFEEKVYSDLNQFLRRFCALVSRSLGISPKQIDEYWDDEFFGPNDNCMQFFEQCILPAVDRPLVLGLDDVDIIFTHHRIAKELLKLLRVWHEQAKTNSIWSKMRLVLAYSTEVYIVMDTNSSPFNVGIEVTLPEFTLSQVSELANRCKINWSDAEPERLMSIVGGHPYLIRVALYHIACHQQSLEQLLQLAPTEAGIYSDHLRRHLRNLQLHPELLAAMETVVNSEQPVCLDSELEFKLHAMGLVQFQENKIAPRSELYRRYFRDRLQKSG